MTKKEFMKRVMKDKGNVLRDFLTILKKKKIRFCLIGGLAVNAYAEPVVSLDLDVVVIAEQIEDLLAALKKKKFRIKKFPNSINISSPDADVRIQIQTDTRYQDFVQRLIYKDILGYHLPVAAIEDVLQGKVWAAQDKQRRPSKRQKDLADIVRLVEAKEELISLVPNALKKKFAS